MLLYTTHITPRLAFMAHWLGMRLFGKPLAIVTNKEDLKDTDLVLNYTNQKLEKHASGWIQPHGLLYETGIHQQNIKVKTRHGLPYFFETGGDYHFDLLAAGFYLIQRYEEYLPHGVDMYGRYAHENSLAFNHGFLQLPLVDLWVEDFKKTLPGDPGKWFISNGCFLPTYDIDIAYSYKGKGLLRNMAGASRSLAQWKLLRERGQVLIGKQQDPFDVYSDLDLLHHQFHLQPIYFLLFAAKTQRYDKNLDPGTPEMKNLVKNITAKYDVGIHPSWQSGDDETLVEKEIIALQSSGITKVSASRQHYIRMDLPHTYEALIRRGITRDYSMGYGSINGFRASTSYAYQWFNMQLDQTTSLTVFPFCYMEANSVFEQNDTPAQALKELQRYHDLIKRTGGTLITIFHNHLIGYDKNGRKWMEMYQQFLAWQSLDPVAML
ncbi:MAG: hypothetical protein ABIX01_03425 [Chitinophagaceae bacterium]